ncbi:hypothetical protein Lser_V15G21273 [Lactuca serriola]
MASTTTAAREYVEKIRRTKFSTDREPNPFTGDLHNHAVKNLSAKLYAKDVHFLTELIQNAEDNEYPEGVDPSLEFVITSKDITETGAPATLLVFNNEKGFSDKNIESICSVGLSTKKGIYQYGYIGQRGIGLTSVFLITDQPYVFSNGPTHFMLLMELIENVNFVMSLSDDVYIELLAFIAEGWKSCSWFYKANIRNTPLIKYVGRDGKVDLFTINEVSGTNKLLAAYPGYISWLSDWSTEFRCATGEFFLLKATQEAIQSHWKKSMLVYWLKEEVKFKFVSVFQYAELVSRSLNNDRVLVVSYAHFLYKSLKKNFMRLHDFQCLCSEMPIVDNYGNVHMATSRVLVPSKGSRWVKLIGSNPWRQHNYVELGEDYTRGACYFGMVTSGEELVSFLKKYVGASDVPYISPPDAAIPTLSSPLSKRSTFLLLEWLRNLRASGVSLPERFLSSIKNGSWLKIYLSGRPGYLPPSESFMLKSSMGNLLQNGSVLLDIPLVDEKFYGDDEMRKYKEELQTIGVRFHDMEAC